MSKDLNSFAKEHAIDYFLVCFTDLAGTMRAKLVPAACIGDVQRGGAGFAGFAAHLDMSPSDPDIFLLPDSSSVIQIPWKPKVAWVTGDIIYKDELLPQSPRSVLKQVLEKYSTRKWSLKTGVEAEFFLLDATGSNISDHLDIQQKPCYDQQAIMRRFELISQICGYIQKLGWGIYQNDHEDANGQFEMNWDYSDALVTADRHAFFKFMVKSLAEIHGYRATFMAKPFKNRTGNGCHAHVSVWEGKKNIFEDRSDKMGLSRKAYNSIGGLMQMATHICALTNPTLNSYKRIHAKSTYSGSTWSPNTISYAGNNRTHMIRIPDAGRFELRVGDGSANPYLLQAAIGAAVWHGISNEIDPGEMQESNVYTESENKYNKLPITLQEAVDSFRESEIVTDLFGQRFVDAYSNYKASEIQDYMNEVTEWEQLYYRDI